MERGEWNQKARDWMVRYRWAVLILAVGLLLMALPRETVQMQETVRPEPSAESSLEQRLEQTLVRLEGAGKVTVLLTQSTGPEYHYQTDSDSREETDTYDRRVETVLITGSDRTQQGLLRRTDPPRYLGAVVLCQGADRPAVRLAVVDAVATATGLTSDKISVLKMK